MSKITLFQEKKSCCACGACSNICPKQAIHMQEDEYGFLYPQIDEEKCIHCGACKRVCAYQNISETNEPLAAYAAINQDKTQKMQSASGGIFAAMATKVLEAGGVVCGAALDVVEEHFVPHHIVITKQEDLYKLQGSKYVQSCTQETYRIVREYLQKQKKVLYSGTPCQIAGLKGFLGKEYPDLITIDLICHGVPSARMFDDFMQVEKKKRNIKKFHSYSFRTKEKGWELKNCRLEYISESGKEEVKYIPARLSSYNTFFYDGLICRENCYSCKYACKNRPGDITLGDYWGIRKEHPDILGKNGYIEQDGISCIIVNTEKGIEFCSSLDRYIRKDASSYEKISRMNGQLKAPSVRPDKRDKILDLYKNDGYIALNRLFYEKYKKQIAIYCIYNKIPRALRVKLKALLKG